MKKALMGAILIAGLFAMIGCGPKPPENTEGDKKDAGVSKSSDPKPTAKDESEEDGGEWCNPHGIAEAECSMCSAKAAKEFKAKGDWCDKHDRAKSQCFICEPSLLEKAKVAYKAKYDKEMPTPKKNMPEKK